LLEIITTEKLVEFMKKSSAWKLNHL